MAFCAQFTEHRTTYPAAIESDANRNVKTVIGCELNNAKTRLRQCNEVKERCDYNLVDGNQHFIMRDVRQLVAF